MSASLCVFKLINPEIDKIKKGLNSKEQKSFADLDLVDEIGDSRSLLVFHNFDDKNNRVFYKATHYSDTISHPIRFFLDDIEETFGNVSKEVTEQITKGTKRVNEYQEIHKFDVIIDFNTNEIFIFSNKRIAHSFIRRFKKAKLVDYEKIYFDMTKIDTIPELSNIWGCWENCKGRCKKKAYFGTEVHKVDGIDKKNITSYNVEYEFDNETIVSLFVAIDCRISSNSPEVKNAELFTTYNTIKNSLGLLDKSEIKETSEEEA